MERETALLLAQIGGHLRNALSDGIAASDRLGALLEQQANAVPQPMQELLAVLRRSQFRTLRTAQNMQTLARLAQDEPLNETTVDLQAYCHSLIHTVNMLAADIDVSFRPSRQPCQLSCDLGLLQELLLNLLENSLLHCSPGDTITLELTRAEDNLHITIRDSGSGIAAPQMDTVFQDHLRAPLLPEAARGAGLGLGTAELIAKRHGGSLVISSGPEGAAATVSLPCRPGAEPRSSPPFGGNELRGILTALSDALDHRSFLPAYL